MFYLLGRSVNSSFSPEASGSAAQGVSKRKQHGSTGSTVLRDPSEADRIWVIFDWDAKGWESFLADPDVPGIMQKAGLKERPVVVEVEGQYDA
jgi:hypothetical protein